MVKKTPAYKNKLRALELERNGGITNKKRSQKNMVKYAIILILYESVFVSSFAKLFRKYEFRNIIFLLLVLKNFPYVVDSYERIVFIL